MIRRHESTAGDKRRRRVFPRLRDVRIRSKLGLILLIPVLALLGVSALRLAETADRAWQAADAEQLTRFGSMSGDLVHELQSERALAALILASPDRDPEKTGFERQVTQTNHTQREYAKLRKTLPAVPGNIAELLDRIDGQLDALDQLRDSVRDRETTLYAAQLRYRTIIGDLISFRGAGAQLSADDQVAVESRAAAALSKVKEYVAQEHVVIVRVAALGRYSPALQSDFVATIAGQQEAQLDFANLATPAQFSKLQQTSIDGNAIEARRYAAILNRTTLNAKVKLSGDLDTLTNAMGMWREALHDVETEVDDDLIKLTQTYRDQQVALGIGEGVAVLIALLVAVLVALVIARSMVTSLRRLREGALAVAYQGLPRAVSRLRDPATLGEQTPEEVARSEPDPVRVHGRDETGQVAKAFNVVHREAIRVAAEQAVLRASVATMFSNLARRSQILVDRLIGQLDQLERNEEDPDRLARLFLLDHLATRMRRNDENLLVLADADSARGQREAAPIADVLRAAQSEVEQYTRIEFGVVDAGVDVAGHAVNDVVHLLAELFDNAIAFSSPDTAVVVDARRVGDRVLVEVEDRGIGISPTQLAALNERLAKPPEVDVTVSRMMGLVVVSRIANRHGIKVELRNANVGTIVDVVLPAGTLVLGPRVSWRQTAGLARPPEPMAIGTAVQSPPPARPDHPAPRGPSADPVVTPGMAARAAPPPRWTTPPPGPRHAEPTPEPYRAGGAYPPATDQPVAGGSVRPRFDPAWFPRDFPTGTPPSAPPTAAGRDDAPASATGNGDSGSGSPGSGSGGPGGGAGSGAYATVEYGPGDIQPGGGDRVTQWASAADVGWRAASEASEPRPAGQTGAGLPKREPMTQLVPGGVTSPGTTQPTARDPEAVRGFLSAYQNGVERGRGRGD